MEEEQQPSSEAGCSIADMNDEVQAEPIELKRQFVALEQLASSEHESNQYQAALGMRQLLSEGGDESSLIGECIATSFFSTFVWNFLRRDELPNLQLEAAWVLGLIAKGGIQGRDHLIDIGAVDALAALLSHTHTPQSAQVRQKAVWALSHLCDGEPLPNPVNVQGAIPVLLDQLTQPTERIEVKRNVMNALSNLCRSKRRSVLDKIASAVPMFVALMNHTDEEIVMDATSALSYISDGNKERVHRVLQDILQDAPILRLVQLLGSSSPELQGSAIRVLGNVVTGNDEQTQLVINAGALQNFRFLLAHPKRGIRKEVCWTLSNITAGTKEQIQAVINAETIPPLLQCMFDSESEVSKEAVWAIANFTGGATKEQIDYLVQVGGLDQLCDLLGTIDTKIVAVSLEALENILGYRETVRSDTSSDTNPYAAALLTNGGLKKLKLLQSHSQQEVYNRTTSLLETYFKDEEWPEPTTTVPATESGYQFQAPQDGFPSFSGRNTAEYGLAPALGSASKGKYFHFCLRKNSFCWPPLYGSNFAQQLALVPVLSLSLSLPLPLSHSGGSWNLV